MQSYAAKVTATALFIFCIFVGGVNVSFAQTPKDDSSVESKKNPADEIKDSSSIPTQEEKVYKSEIAVWGGYSPVSVDIIGSSSPNVRFGIVGIRYARKIGTLGNLNFKYTVDLIPLVILNYEQERFFPTAPDTFRVERNRRTAYGFGGSPGGVQMNFRRQKKVQPFIGVSFGVLYFNEDVPDNRSPAFPDRRGKKFNYTADLGVGVEIGLKPDRKLIVGYKYYHISNFYAGGINPGYNSNIFYAGYSFLR